MTNKSVLNIAEVISFCKRLRSAATTYSRYLSYNHERTASRVARTTAFPPRERPTSHRNNGDALDAPHPHNNSTRRGWIHLSNLCILASVAIIIVASSASPSCRRQSRIHRCYNQHHNVGEKYKETIRLD